MYFLQEAGYTHYAQKGSDLFVFNLGRCGRCNGITRGNTTGRVFQPESYLQKSGLIRLDEMPETFCCNSL